MGMGEVGVVAALEAGAILLLDAGTAAALELGAVSALELVTTAALELVITTALEFGTTAALEFGTAAALEIGMVAALEFGTVVALEPGTALDVGVMTASLDRDVVEAALELGATGMELGETRSSLAPTAESPHAEKRQAVANVAVRTNTFLKVGNIMDLQKTGFKNAPRNEMLRGARVWRMYYLATEMLRASR